MPGEEDAGIIQRLGDLLPACQRYVRVLSAKNQHQLALDVAGPFQRIVAVLAEGAALKVSRVKTAAGAHLRIERRPESQMPAEAEADGAEPAAARRMALQGLEDDLGVVIEVAGSVYGPSSVIKDSYRPIWDYTFPQPITWKLGDPITIRLIDYDWSASEVYVLHSRQGDPLGMRLLAGTITPTKGGKTTLVFASDFTLPVLSPPE